MKRILAILAALTLPAHGAFTEFYVQPTASNLNAGSTADDAAELTFTSGDFVQGTGVFTAAGANLSGVSVGEWASVYADGATVTGFSGRITAVDDGADTITVSTTIKSGTAPTDGTGNRSIKVGGAWDGPATTVAFPFGFVQATAVDASSNPTRVNIKGGTAYDITAAMTHANNGYIRWEGYTTAAGDGGMAEIDGGATGTSYILLTISATNNEFRNLIFDHNGDSGTAGAGVEPTGAGNAFYRCHFKNMWRAGARASGSSVWVECEASGNQLDDASAFGGFSVNEESLWIRCIAHDNDGGSDSEGWNIASDSTEPTTFIQCISDNNGANGWNVTASHVHLNLIQCVANGNTESGVDLTATTITTRSIVNIESCLFVGNGQYGVENDAVGISYPFLRNNAFHGNGTDQTTGINASFLSGSITLTGDPFTDQANGDFSLNNTAGAGAAARNAGVGTFLQDAGTYSGTTVSYPSVGAQQPDEPVGGGGGKSSIFLR